MNHDHSEPSDEADRCPARLARRECSFAKRRGRRVWFGLTTTLLVTTSVVACGAVTPDAPWPGGRTGATKVTVTRIDPGESTEPASTGPTPMSDGAPTTARPLDPAAKPTVSAAAALLGGSTAESPLPLPTALATSRSHLFAFARTRAGWIVRTRSTKAKSPVWSPPSVVATAFDDDARPFVIADGELAWFGVSSSTGGTRVVRVEAPTTAGPRIQAVAKVPANIGRLASFVALKPHVAVVGQDGDAITFARLDRTAGFLDTAAKIIGRGQPSMATTASRAPRATNEDDQLLVAWDANDVPGALEAPGTTAAERAAPKPGIFIRRFHPNGAPASPTRRLTRPSFEAHALDVVVELGACAVLARTDEGFEMFRFVRKGDGLAPYGGGLHLAPPGGDVALGADVIGTIGVTSNKLLRIGPGIKVVSSPLGLSPPPGGAFDEVRIAMDGQGAHVVLTTKTALGPLPTIARIDGEHMGAMVPTPWVGPPPQRVAFADVDGDEALALVIGGGGVHAVRLALDGSTKSTSALPIDPLLLPELHWPRAPFPRTARAAGEWVIALRDGRALFATGPRAGRFVTAGPPKGAPVGGTVAFVPSAGKEATVRVVYVPPPDRTSSLWTTTIDPKLGTMGTWSSIPGTEHNYGALGVNRFAGLPRTGGGLWLLTNSGPKVSTAAQLYGLVSVDVTGAVVDESIDEPAPVQEISLTSTTSGPAVIATLTGMGVATRWLDGSVKGWRESFAFMPFQAKGDGPALREKGVPTLIGPGSLPVELDGAVSAFLGDRCPFQLVSGQRALLLACEEGSDDSPLATRATARVLRF